MKKHETSQSKKAILLHESDIGTLIILQRLLSDLFGKTYDIIAVATLAEAMISLLSRPVSLAIVGYSSTQRDGIELVRWIRDSSLDIFIIFSSMELNASLTQQALHAGANACLSQPFPLDDFEILVKHGLLDVASRPPHVPLSLLDTRAAQEIYVYVKAQYRHAGFPYGDNTFGVLRWLKERLDLDTGRPSETINEA